MSRTRQWLRFGAVGIVGLAIDVAVLEAARALGAGYYGGRALSFLAAASGTWLLNRIWTFRAATAAATRGLAGEWARYVTLMLAGGAVNYAVYAACIEASTLVRTWPGLGVAAGSLAGMVINYASARWLVFRGAAAR